MLRRITDLWPSLLGNNQNAQEEDDQIQEDESNVNKATEEQLAELRAQTEEIYKNMNWTRIIAVDDHHPEETEIWPISIDLTNEYDELFSIDEEELPQLIPRFDPVQF